MAENANGQQCQSRGVLVVGEWRSCRRPEHAADRQIEAPDDEPRSHARRLIGEALNHAKWELVPGEIKHLIEHAWVQSEREGWDAGWQP